MVPDPVISGQFAFVRLPTIQDFDSIAFRSDHYFLDVVFASGLQIRQEVEIHLLEEEQRLIACGFDHSEKGR
jgi:hypothetical protein